MTDQPGEEYEALFRPAEPTPEPVVAEPTETGRVFKSQGVHGNEEALLALPSSRTSKLRTLERVNSPAESEHASQGAMAMHSPAPKRSGQIPAPESAKGQRVRESRRGTVFGALSALWIYGITVGVTLIFGLVDVLIFGGEPGALSGFGLLAVSVFASLAIRSQDDSQAIFAPAIAFFVMAMTVGQINVTDTSLINRFVSVFFTLGNNWYWVIGSTIIALGVVAFRRRSFR